MTTDDLPQREMTLDEWMARLPKHHGAHLELDAIRASLAAARAEAKSYRETNESVAVCANHTEDILYSDECPCVICELHTAHADLAALRQRHAADKSCRTCRWLVVAESDGRPLCEIGVRGCVDRETGLCAAWLASEAKARLT